MRLRILFLFFSYLTKLETLFGFHQLFPVNLFMFQEPIQGTAVQWVVSLPSLLCMWHFPGLSLPFMTLTVSRYLYGVSVWAISPIRMFHDLDLSDVFVMMSLELWTFFSFLFFFFWLYLVAWGNLCPLQRKHNILITEPQGSSRGAMDFEKEYHGPLKPPNHMSGCINKWYPYVLTSTVSSRHLRQFH